MLVRHCSRFAAQKPEVGLREERRKDLQKLDTLVDRSDHPVHPLAGVVVGQHDVQS